FPIIGALDGDDPLLDLVDDRLPEQLLPNVAAPRIRSAFRAALAEEEIATRQDLFAVLGAADWSPQEMVPVENCKVLFVGRPSAAYLAIERALADLGVNSEASPITATALEYAQDNDVDVVIADGIESSDEALRFCLSLRANAGLHHLPGALLAPARFDQSTYAMTRGVSEIISATDPAADIARRIMRLARQKRRLDRMKRYFAAAQSGMPADSAGLFAREVLARRLQRHISVAEASARPFSVAILRLETGDGPREELETVAKDVALVLKRVLRIEDTAGTFDWRTFAILMPASTAAGAKAALTRLIAVLEANVLQSARTMHPDIDIQTSAAEFKPGEPAGAFLMRAAAA
ncbi:MAG: hypothetical protein ABWZ40_05230, partial [Caulobacterales bacterium]